MCIHKHRMTALLVLLALACLTRGAYGQSQTARNPDVLTLEQAIALALQDNPKIKNAAIDVTRAAEEFAATRTRRLPNFNFQVVGSQQLTPLNFTFERGVFGTFPGIGPVPAENTKLSTPMQPTAIFITQISQPLSQLYRTNLNLNQLRLKSQIAQEELRLKQQQIVRDVKRAYFALLQTESAMAAASETIRMYKELDRVTGDYVAQRVALKTESLDVKSRLARSEYDTMTLADQLSTQKQQLNLLLGRDVLTEFSVAAVPDADSYESDLTMARTRALAARPELKEARLKVQQAEGDRRVKKAEYIPDVSFTFQHFATANFNSFIPKNYMNAGITLSWEIFDWGRKKHELAEKELATRQAHNAVRDAESAVVIDVTEKFNHLRQARQFLSVTQLGRDAALENVRVLANRYQVQMALLKDVLQAQSQLEQANNQGHQALLNFWMARAEFENAIGEDQ